MNPELPKNPELPRAAWFDVSAGTAGDMMLGALLDAGADLAAVQAAIDAVLPGAIRLSQEEVLRAGLRARRVQVSCADDRAEPRAWSSIRELLEAAPLTETVRERALMVFQALAEAEGRVHGISAADVHFHEVGALDSIADIVGCCAALDALGVSVVQAGRIALGSGTVATEHGELAVPVPAVLELTRGWPVSGTAAGELATPTGVALVTALGQVQELLPPMRVLATGVGAGTRNPTDRANVVRVVIGTIAEHTAGTNPVEPAIEVLLEANIDDIDARIWPTVLSELLEAGASDAWLSPILMKKGRPAHTLHVLAPQQLLPELRALVFRRTTTFGVRSSPVTKYALARTWQEVAVGQGSVRIKLAIEDDRIVQATPEFEDAVQLAAETGASVGDVLTLATAAAVQLGLIAGAPAPPSDHSP